MGMLSSTHEYTLVMSEDEYDYLLSLIGSIATKELGSKHEAAQKSLWVALHDGMRYGSTVFETIYPKKEVL